jgi:uncharacterized protein YdaU (DUF1376 family)
MSRAYVAFYMGDYARDTQELSTLEHGAYFLLLNQCWVHGSLASDPARRAAIAKLTSREWRKVAPAVERFFDEDGRQKRATTEIEKADRARERHALAGHKGGMAKARSSYATAGPQRGHKPRHSGAVALREDITKTFSGTAREQESGSAMQGVEKPQIATGSLAEVIAAKGWVKP